VNSVSKLSTQMIECAWAFCRRVQQGFQRSVLQSWPFAAARPARLGTVSTSHTARSFLSAQMRQRQWFCAFITDVNGSEFPRQK